MDLFSVQSAFGHATGPAVARVVGDRAGIGRRCRLGVEHRQGATLLGGAEQVADESGIVCQLVVDRDAGLRPVVEPPPKGSHENRACDPRGSGAQCPAHRAPGKDERTILASGVAQRHGGDGFLVKDSTFSESGLALFLEVGLVLLGQPRVRHQDPRGTLPRDRDASALGRTAVHRLQFCTRQGGIGQQGLQALPGFGAELPEPPTFILGLSIVERDPSPARALPTTEGDLPGFEQPDDELKELLDLSRSCRLWRSRWFLLLL